MSFQKHNKSSVHLPPGLSRNNAKRMVYACSKLSERARSLLVYVLDQAESWTLTVQSIRADMQWGEQKWTTTRNLLIKYGILTQTKTPTGRNSHSWTLYFDFVVLADMAKLSTDILKTSVSRTRVRDTPSKPGDRVTPLQNPGIARDAKQNPGLDTCTNLKKPPQAGGGEEVDQEENDDIQALRDLLADEPAKETLFEKLVQANADQQIIFANVVTNGQAKTNRAAWLSRLATLAQNDQLTSSEPNAAASGMPSPAQAWAALCANNAHLAGVLTAPSGPVAETRAAAGGILYCPLSAGAFSLKRSAKLWGQLAEGELTLASE